MIDRLYNITPPFTTTTHNHRFVFATIDNKDLKKYFPTFQMVTKVKFNKSLTKTDPQQHPVLIIGQLRHLSILQFDHVRCKLEPRVTEETFKSALTCLHPSPTDYCPLFLDVATIAALPTKTSRHNTPSRAHSVTALGITFSSKES